MLQTATLQGRAMCCAANSDFTRQGNVLCCKQRFYNRQGNVLCCKQRFYNREGIRQVNRTAIALQAGHSTVLQNSGNITATQQSCTAM